MPDIAFLSDTPLALDAGDKPTSTIQVAELGKFTDPRYGDFQITSKMVASWQRNLAGYLGGQVAVDYDHATDRGGSSEAAGWITSLNVDGTKVMASVEWTPEGAQAVKDKRWRFISPTFTDKKRDEKGQPLGDTLLRVALTNDPFLRGMAAVTLSAARPEFAERVQEDPADSRAAMPEFTKKLAAALGVDDDEAKVLAAVADLKAAAEKTPEAPDLKVLAAADPSVVLLTVAEHEQLKGEATQATALAERLTSLEAERATEKFTAAYDTAFTEGRVDAKPETRELHAGIYKNDPDGSLKLLASLPKIVNTTPKGAGGSQGDVNTPAGGDPGRFELDAQVKAHMAEHNITDYSIALAAVTKEA